MKDSLSLVVFLFVVAGPAMAQQRRVQNEEQAAPRPSPVDQQAGRTATTVSGEIGQRQSREKIAPNAAPLGRVQNRIGNRVQNRIRNRIDRYYNPEANAASPFDVASEQARATARPRR